MTTLKCVVRSNDKKKDGTSPIFFCITKNRIKAFLHTGYHINPLQWDGHRPKKSHDNYKRLVSTLKKKRESELWDKILEEERKNPMVTARQLRDIVSGSGNDDFYEYALRFIEQFNGPNKGTYRRYNANINNLKAFRPTLSFTDITFEFLRNYEAHLRKELKAANTIAGQMKAIRAIMYAAFKDGKADKNNNPFDYYKLKWEEGSIGWLTKDELEAIKQVDSPNFLTRAARDIFMFQFYCRGVRISDALTLRRQNIQDGLWIRKTIKAKHVETVSLVDEAMQILSRNDEGNKYIFPFLNKCKNMGSAEALVNRHLKKVASLAGIRKRLTSHMARHTWASRGVELGLPSRVLQGGLGHGDLATTERYMLKFTNKELDEYNRKIIDG